MVVAATAAAAAVTAVLQVEVATGIREILGTEAIPIQEDHVLRGRHRVLHAARHTAAITLVALILPSLQVPQDEETLMIDAHHHTTLPRDPHHRLRSRRRRRAVHILTTAVLRAVAVNHLTILHPIHLDDIIHIHHLPLLRPPIHPQQEAVRLVHIHRVTLGRRLLLLMDETNRHRLSLGYQRLHHQFLLLHLLRPWVQDPVIVALYLESRRRHIKAHILRTHDPRLILLRVIHAILMATTITIIIRTTILVTQVLYLRRHHPGILMLAHTVEDTTHTMFHLFYLRSSCSRQNPGLVVPWNSRKRYM